MFMFMLQLCFCLCFTLLCFSGRSQQCDGSGQWSLMAVVWRGRGAGVCAVVNVL